MAKVKTYSLRNIDEALSQWIKDNGIQTPGGESGLVRLALYSYMNIKDEQNETLNELVDSQKRIEAKQDEILRSLVELRTL